MKQSDIPTPTIKRLSLYLRYPENCAAREVKTISSKQLGETLNLTDVQVRKDLAYFGPFGHPGIGYRVGELIDRIRRILGTDRTWDVVLVGAGNLGRALVAYRGFSHKGFNIAAVFDNDFEKVGREVSGFEGQVIRHTDDLVSFVRPAGIKLGILAVPATQAQLIAELMWSSGIKGILNFAPVSLSIPPGVAVSGVDMAVHLEQLSFQVGGGGGPTAAGDEPIAS